MWLAHSSIFFFPAKTTLSVQGYGFCWWRRYHALPSQLSYQSTFVYCIVNIKYIMEFLFLIFYASLRLRFLDVETNPDPRRPVPAVCRILCSNVRGLTGNLSDLTVSSSQYVILLSFMTLVSDMSHVSELLVPRSIRSPCLVVPGQVASGSRDGCIRMKWLRINSPT